MSSVIEESDELHSRVRDHGRRALSAGHRLADEFDSLAADIARFQEKWIPGYARLVAARGAPLVDAASLPAVPVDAFRLSRVAAHPPELDVARFATSGTTSELSGVHCFRTTDTYRELALAMGQRALASPWEGPRVVVALAAPPGPKPASSLAFMMRAFMQEWDARSFDDSPFDADAGDRWLLAPNGVDLRGLERAARVALERDEPLVVLATGFALVLLLDALDGRRIVAPERTVVMPTGGFKGRTREIEPGELIERIAGTFGIDPRQIVGEYGMTELSSQLYEGTLPRGALEGARGVFLEPPWLRVTPVDPVSLEPVPEGQVGLARFVDLANVDSAVAIVTQDLVERREGGVVLRGRQATAPSRGCSLAVEQMVVSAERWGL